MPSKPTHKSGRGRGSKVKRYRRGNLLKHLKTLDDFVDNYVLVKPLKQIGYCWGGQPTEGTDVPDILYVTVLGKDYEIGSNIVEPVYLTSEVKHDASFENTSGGGEDEAVA